VIEMPAPPDFWLFRVEEFVGFERLDVAIAEKGGETK
jgi:hypothetical protein